MSAQDVTRVDIPIAHAKTRIARVDYRYSEPQGPTPTWAHLGNELDRLANVWGTADRGWVARCNGASWTVSAYLGKPSCIVAVTTDREMRVALARLLGELFQVDGT